MHNANRIRFPKYGAFSLLGGVMVCLGAALLFIQYKMWVVNPSLTGRHRLSVVFGRLFSGDDGAFLFTLLALSTFLGGVTFIGIDLCRLIVAYSAGKESPN
jgi:hypothetical protein